MLNGKTFCKPWFTLILAMLAVHPHARAADKPAPKRPAAARKVLSPKPDQWQILDRWFRPNDAQSEQADGRDVLIPNKRGLVLIAPETLQTGQEVVLLVRMRAKDQKMAMLTLHMALEDPKNARERGFQVAMSYRPGTGRIGYSMPNPLGDPNIRREKWIRGYLTPNGIGNRSLAWPDRLRQIIEHEIASLPKPEELWLTLRFRALADGFRAYLNDRMITERRGAGCKITGPVRLMMLGDVQLARMTMRKAKPLDPIFTTVSLGSCLNAAEINGKKLPKGALPGPDEPVRLDGVPFTVPEPDAKGNNHIDIGTSWLQSGYLEGQQPSRRGPMGGRWSGAFQMNPSRIQFAVRNDRYRAIHLLATCDGDPDSTPVITAQFYKPSRGFPRQFSATVPLFTAKADKVTALPVKLADGSTGRLWHVVIPIDPGQLAAFDDIDVVEIELTKQARILRTYPDPTHYSVHGAGLPSAVRVFAMTLERPAVHMTVTPGAFADTWTAPSKPSYQVALFNRTNQARTVVLRWAATSHDGESTFQHQMKVTVPAGGKQVDVKLEAADLEKYGYYKSRFILQDVDQSWTEERGLVYLHADTRERGDWQKGRGPIWGFWNWRGGHNTPSGAQQVDLMGRAGAESTSGSFGQSRVSEEEHAAARKWKMVTFKAFGAGDHYITNRFRGNLAKLGLEKAREKFLADLKKSYVKPSDIDRPELISFFPEPHIGQITYSTLPSYYGEKPFTIDESLRDRYENYLNGFIEGAKIVKKHYPNVKCMLPHGDPLFPAPFLRFSKEVRELIDGTTVDIPVFERLPEHQMHQVALHRMYMCRQEYRKAGIEKPLLPMYEGPCRPSHPGALSDQELADLSVRDSLILIAYGVDRQCGGWCPFDSASYWGEQHYGGGTCHRLPRATPKPAFAAFGTMTRHLNRRNMTKWLPTGSLSTYALQFAHYKTGELLHVMWTIRGKRPVTLTVPTGSKVVVYDQMDNPVPLKLEGQRVTFTITPSPCYVRGVKGDPKIALGEPDHSDARPAEGAIVLASLGDGSWKQSAERDEDYESSHDIFIKRFPGNLSIKPVKAPADKGGQALAVHLGKQERKQKVMPYYTTLLPAKPIRLPGKGSHIGIWARAASDWGRVVYAMRDAKGERWISVGLKGAWNCDDMYNWSYFNFDGWRYLRFELPSNSPWDTFREKGSTWWGHYGPGDGIVDLPLTLEKIFVERRTHAMYVNSPEPARPDDVLLGNVLVEYERPEDKTDEAIRLSRLRMPIPKGAPKLDNPIAELRESGAGEPTQITRITLPDQHADGTRCYVHFKPVPEAKSYDVWVSTYESGLGALQLGRNWKEPGQLLRGLRPDTDFYLFVVYTDQKGKQSKPSAPLKIQLKDIFGMK